MSSSVKRKEVQMPIKYKVQIYQNNMFEVLIEEYDLYEDESVYQSVFQGSLSDCEAYVNLHERGLM